MKHLAIVNISQKCQEAIARCAHVLVHVCMLFNHVDASLCTSQQTSENDTITSCSRVLHHIEQVPCRRAWFELCSVPLEGILLVRLTRATVARGSTRAKNRKCWLPDPYWLPGAFPPRELFSKGTSRASSSTSSVPRANITHYRVSSMHKISSTFGKH